MDKENQEITCGCDCAACMRGDHEHCQGQGTCRWQKTNTDDEEDE